MKPPYRDNEPYAFIMVRRNSGRKGWKTLMRRARRVRDDAVHDPARTHRFARRCAERMRAMH
ncbi:hypothetical protein [Burkholderia pseudomultivorans]|uniref:hypothetical protein n=1 Tax=Burkholderia pseudomultivorans TaxID=1207504 RepID=UPI0009BCB536|nr:hypothetical protein [Burkholderia pseudomultivorans]